MDPVALGPCRDGPQHWIIKFDPTGNLIEAGDLLTLLRFNAPRHWWMPAFDREHDRPCGSRGPSGSPAPATSSRVPARHRRERIRPSPPACSRGLQLPSDALHEGAHRRGTDIGVLEHSGPGAEVTRSSRVVACGAPVSRCLRAIYE